MQIGKLEIDELANRLANAFPKQTLIEQQVIVQLLRQFLAEGKPVLPKRMAEAFNLPLGQVEEILAAWAGWGNVYFDKDHRVIAAWGLGLHHTAHRFVVNGHTLYTWCAVDPFYIADLLGTTARVESVCPITKEKVSFMVGPDGVKDVVPTRTVVSLILPDSPITTDVRLCFCHFVHFFASAEAGSTWISEQAGTFRLLSVEQAVSLMQSVNKLCFEQVISRAAPR